MEKGAKIFVAGHRGLVGSALVRRLAAEGYDKLILRNHAEVDLTCQSRVKTFFEEAQPDYVFLAAARVGGIIANSTRPADFIYENLAIQNNVIRCAYLHGIKKLLFLGSSCIYPRDCPQPMKEDYLLGGKLEPTNEPYAVAKIAGIKLCQAYNQQYGTNFISVMPTNLYGPHDNFDLESSHVLAALIRKMHEGKMAKGREVVVVWGSGSPRREFLHAVDLADACIFLMHHYRDSDIINIGHGKDISIKTLATVIKNIVGYEGDVVFDASKPDGTPRKLLDVSKLTNLGWFPKIGLEEGIRLTYEWYVKDVSGANV
jgi:GDP-L-fucose synthase